MAPRVKIDKPIIIEDGLPYGMDNADTQVYPAMEALADDIIAYPPPEVPLDGERPTPLLPATCIRGRGFLKALERTLIGAHSLR